MPLAIVVIAGILSNKDKEVNLWEDVGKNLDRYMLSDGNNSMMRILELSYKHIPHCLKPCFLYLGVFKEDAKIHVKDLVHPWIALGYIFEEGKRSAECVAKEYLEKLIDRSLVIVVERRRSDGGAKVCAIHDLLRDFCLRIVRKENVLRSIDGNSYMWNQRYLYLYLSRKHLLYNWASRRNKRYGLRSGEGFHPFWNWESPFHALSNLPPYLSVCSYWGSPFSVLNLRLLRGMTIHVELEFDLGMMGFDFAGMEFLVHLRYLNVPKMPTLLHKYVNLEVLIVRGEVYLTSNILRMIKLKCIMSVGGIFNGDCDILSQSSKLEYLSSVHLHNLKELEMLKCVPNLRKLKLQCSRSSVEPEMLTSLDLKFLTQLESLEVYRWHGEGKIKFPSNITKLSSLWVSLKIMSTIGALPYLQVLKLDSVGFKEGDERLDTGDGEFEQLRILKLQFMPQVQWNVSSSQNFSKLQRLFLKDCYNLNEISSEIGDIEMLQLIKLSGWSRKSLVESAIRIQEEQHDMGNDCLMVDIQDAEIQDCSGVSHIVN